MAEVRVSTTELTESNAQLSTFRAIAQSCGVQLPELFSEDGMDQLLKLDLSASWADEVDYWFPGFQPIVIVDGVDVEDAQACARLSARVCRVSPPACPQALFAGG